MTLPALSPRSRQIPSAGGPGHLIRRAHRAVASTMGEVLSELGIAVNHYFYLRALFEQDGLTPAELSARIGMDRATVTNVLDTMQAQDLVRRAPHPHDRRRVCIFLTARGEGLREPVLDAMATVNATAVEGISAAEFEHFRTTIEKIIANLTSQPC